MNHKAFIWQKIKENKLVKQALKRLTYKANWNTVKFVLYEDCV